MRNKAFLYIDILGFSSIINNNPKKIEKIFDIIDSLLVHNHFAFKTIVFSDTILVFNNKDNSRDDTYYVTYLCEFVQDFYYRAIRENIYFRAIITKGEFKYKKLHNIESYYGKALVDCYRSESQLKMTGLFISNDFAYNVITFPIIKYNEDFTYVFPNQALDNLNNLSNGTLPIDIKHFEETDMLWRIDEDLLFFREILYLKDNHPINDVRIKFNNTYLIYKKKYPRLINKLEKEEFLPWSLNSNYTGSINPFNSIAKNELKRNIMRHNGIDYDVIWLSDNDYKEISNNPKCEGYKRETLLVNQDTLDYYYCGEIRNKPDKNSIDKDLIDEKEKN